MRKGRSIAAWTVYAMWSHLGNKRNEHEEHNEKNVCTYCGAYANRSAVTKSDCTPKKNVSFSKVRTTFAECNACESEAIRLET